MFAAHPLHIAGMANGGRHHCVVTAIGCRRSSTFLFLAVPLGHAKCLRLRPPARRRSMPAEGTLPAARTLAIACALVTATACTSRRIERYGALEWSVDRSRVAFSRDRLCEKSPCESLYVGATMETAAAVAGLGDGPERWCE